MCSTPLRVFSEVECDQARRTCEPIAADLLLLKAPGLGTISAVTRRYKSSDILANSWIHFLPRNASVLDTTVGVVNWSNCRTADVQLDIWVNDSRKIKTESSRSIIRNVFSVTVLCYRRSLGQYTVET